MTGGVYRYDPGHHDLLLVSPGRQCEKYLTQRAVKNGSPTRQR